MFSRFAQRLVPTFLLLLATVALSAAPASAISPRPVDEVVKCRTNRAAFPAPGYFDSLFQTINGDPISTDTSTTVTTADWDWTSVHEGVANTTAYAAAELFVWSAIAPASFDTLWVATDRRVSGGAWAPGAFVAFLPAAANDPLIVVPIFADADAATSTFLVPELRFRLRCDGNSAALFQGAKLLLRHFNYNK